ncbi:MAG: succinate CoA transferase [Burkholderiaceae bacterium]|jgi:succinyl-CoA:acetate CoA-transferase|nr:succinate CoA transferase [Burkholderiaceae bacterium]
MTTSIENRIRMPHLRERIISAERAAALIRDGMTVGMSAFTNASSPKLMPLAIAERAKTEKFKFKLITGASHGGDIDGILADAGVISKRMPFQTDPVMRAAINRGDILFIDQHLSKSGALLLTKEIDPVDIAIVEAVAVNEVGGVILSTSVGTSEIFLRHADKIILEINLAMPMELEGIHDIYIPDRFPIRHPIPIMHPRERVGSSAVQIDTSKVAGVVITNQMDAPSSIWQPDEKTQAIANHLTSFLLREIDSGRLTTSLMPIQAGIGSVANAVLAGMIEGPFTGLTVFSEVMQDAMFDLFDAGKLDFASATSITLSPEKAEHVFNNLHLYRDKIVLRPQLISNHPEFVNRLGVIAINTAIEMDIYGNVNSTHIMGTNMMNGIGGAGDFARNAHLTIFVSQAERQDGNISCVVPMVTHVDQTEHDTDILVTDVGLADLRGLAPRERAESIIQNCTTGKYKEMLLEYFEEAKKRGGHTPHLLEKAFSWHERYRQARSMLP